jgi:integrase
MRAWHTQTRANLSARASTRCRRSAKLESNRPETSGFQEITRLELTSALKEIEARAVEVTRNLRNHLWGIFEYAIDSGLIGDNPVPPVRVLRKRNQTNHPALTPDMLGEFLRMLDALDTVLEQTRIAMLMVTLTACRKAEVTDARWDEIDLETGEWEIPAARMKANRTHWVPLSRQVVDMLRMLRQSVAPESVYLFPNRDDPSRPMAGRTLNAILVRLGFSGDGTPHGMRATFSTYFNAAGANIDVIEHCLAHVPANRVRAAYNRHAYQAERRQLLQDWADHIDKLRSTTK